MKMPAAIAKFLAERRPMLIGGKWIGSGSGGMIDVVDPATEETIGSATAAGQAEIDAAVAAAQAAFDGGAWAEVNPYEKSKILWRIAELLEQHAEPLAWLNTLENGKPLSASRQGDIPAAAKTFRHYAGLCTKIQGSAPQISMAPNSFHAYVRREPIGVVGQIVPWNGPIVASSWKLAPALAAGCTIVFKPAEETPLTALYIGQLLIEAGVPPGVVNIVPGYGHDAGAAISAHPRIRKVAFTGSTEVGRQIVHSASGNLKKLSLELGGKSPVVIFKDADLDRAITGAANAIFFNAGQVCIAGSRLYVEEPVYGQVVDGIVRIAESLKIGPGVNDGTQMGPLVSRRQLDRVLALVDKGRREGGRVRTGGGRLGDKGYFMAPTVFDRISQDATILREEIFGPVLCAMPFRDLSDVITRANDTDYGLAASVWTRDLARAHAVSAAVQAGLVWVNCHGVSDPAIAFGGYKESGWGRENGWEGMEQYMETKSVIMNVT